MKNRMAEMVYETLFGLLEDDYCVPGVHNAFQEGSTCAVLYETVLEAYQRLCDRLDVEEEDKDVEVIINSFLKITKILCLDMFAYGVQMADLMR